MKKFRLWAVLAASVLFIYGCSQSSNTQSGSGGASVDLSRAENTVNLNSGGLVYIVHDSAGTVGVAVQAKVKMRASGDAAPGSTTGTLNWGDNRTSRVRDGQLARHVYNAPGTYMIAVEIDDDEKVKVGTIRIAAAPVAVEESSTTTRVNILAGSTCTPMNGTDIDEFDFVSVNFPDYPPPALRPATVTEGVLCPSPSMFPADLLPNASLPLGSPFGSMCGPGSTFVVRVVLNDGSGQAECSWPVVMSMGM